MDASRLAESEDGWALTVPEWTVTRCFVDPAAFGLLINGGTGDILRVYIEASFTLRDAEGRQQTFGDSDDPMTRAPLLALMGRAVEDVLVSRNSDLTIRFVDGTNITVTPDPKYEAWELEGLGRLILICPPGGGEPIRFGE